MHNILVNCSLSSKSFSNMLACMNKVEKVSLLLFSKEYISKNIRLLIVDILSAYSRG